MKNSTLLILFSFFLLLNKINAQFAYTRDIKDSAEYLNVYNLLATKAGNSIIATTTPDVATYGGIYLSKFNFRGGLIWSKNYSFFNPYTFFGLKSMAIENDGFIAIAALVQFDGYGSIVFKADSNGNPVWIKWLKPDLKKYNVIPLGGVYANDKSIYIVNIIVDSGLLIQKLNKNGEPLWNRYLHTDSIPRVETKFVFANISPDDGIVISTTTSKPFDSRGYNHFYKISKNGNPEWVYEIKQDSNYVSGMAAQFDDGNKLNILYSRNYNYAYSILDPTTGQSKTYEIGETVFDLQAYFQKNNLNLFNGLSFPFIGLSMYAFTKNKSFVESTEYQIGLKKMIPRIQLYDSLGRICPDFKLPRLKNKKSEIKLKYLKSSYHFSPPPVAFSVIDTVVAIENMNVITNVCAGRSPSPLHSSFLNEATNTAIYELTIFPDPVKDKLTIEIIAPSTQLSKIDIINIDGSILKSESVMLTKGRNNKTLNMSGITAGVYTVKLLSASGLITQKIIKQ